MTADKIRIRAVLGPGSIDLLVDGHEEHVRGGVVCAAVSAITQTALLGLKAVADQHPDLVEIDITDTLLSQIACIGGET